jgi:hypothetical protein
MNTKYVMPLSLLLIVTTYIASMKKEQQTPSIRELEDAIKKIFSDDRNSYFVVNPSEFIKHPTSSRFPPSKLKATQTNSTDIIK